MYFGYKQFTYRFIVKGGHVTLEGVVSNEGDSRIANMAVHQVAGKFSVVNNLRIEK